MNSNSPGNGGSESRNFGDSADVGGDGRRKIADTKSEVASQTSSAAQLGARAVGAASGGGVPQPLKRGG